MHLITTSSESKIKSKDFMRRKLVWDGIYYWSFFADIEWILLLLTFFLQLFGRGADFLLPPSSLLLYPFPYGLFMQIQDEESINSMVWSSPHTYTKKANSFSLLMEMAKKAIDRPPENLVCQHSYQYEESTWLRFQVDCHQLNQFVPNVLGKGFLGILKERLLSLEKWPIFLKITTISKVTFF